MYRIGLVERPVGTLDVFIFLHKSKEGTITSFIRAGWNRRTIEQSLGWLLKLGLVDKTETSRFPRFEKKFSLTPSGRYVARFAKLLKEACERNARHSPKDLSRFPKGCLRVLVYFSRKEWQGISVLLKETGLSANQAYKCMKVLDKAEILSIRKEMGRKTRILSCKLTSVGTRIALIVDALDSALDKSLSGMDLMLPLGS